MAESDHPTLFVCHWTRNHRLPGLGYHRGGTTTTMPDKAPDLYHRQLPGNESYNNLVSKLKTNDGLQACICVKKDTAFSQYRASKQQMCRETTYVIYLSYGCQLLHSKAALHARSCSPCISFVILPSKLQPHSQCM